MTTLLAPAGATAANAATVQANTSKFVWVTPEEYASMRASSPALSAIGSGSSALGASINRHGGGTVVPNDPNLNPYYVLNAFHDLNGVYTPIRRGNSSFGYEHYAVQHNLTSPNPIHAAFQTHKPDVQLGAHLEYIALLTDTSNLNVKLTVRVIVQAASRTDDGAWKTPDGSNIGVITAYCQGYNVCPSWANQ